jgi:hypothetical protein
VSAYEQAHNLADQKYGVLDGRLSALEGHNELVGQLGYDILGKQDRKNECVLKPKK